MLFRTSYSMLGAWAKGDFQNAVDMYLNKEIKKSQQMIDGTKFHELWEKQGRQTGRLPKIFGGRELVNPKFEQYDSVMLNDWLQFAFVLDVEEDTNGIDYKSGAQTANACANSNQHECYHVARPHLKTFEYYAFNQYSNEVTVAIVHLTDQTLRNGVEFILKNATEMRAYVQANGIEYERKARK